MVYVVEWHELAPCADSTRLGSITSRHVVLTRYRDDEEKYGSRDLGSSRHARADLIPYGSVMSRHRAEANIIFLDTK